MLETQMLDVLSVLGVAREGADAVVTYNAPRPKMPASCTLFRVLVFKLLIIDRGMQSVMMSRKMSVAAAVQ